MTLKTTFTDSRVVIRPFCSEDVPLLFEAARESVRELSIWMPWCSPDYSLEDSRKFVRSRAEEWEKGEHYSFVVAEPGTGRFLGGVGLNFFNRVHNFANLGYWVRSSQTRRGVASSAVRLAARFGFEELKLERLEIVAALDNHASQRVADKAGAQREGILRRRLLIHGQYHDAAMFSIVSDVPRG
jgi:RimJ/RimL family protein N-acetyltransferase